VRTELMHEKSHIQLTMVQLPGMNTAQFGWARNKMDQAMQPVPPVYQPEVAAEAIYSVIQRPVNELWVGKSTIQSILGQVFFPRLLDRLMVKKRGRDSLPASRSRQTIRTTCSRRCAAIIPDTAPLTMARGVKR
jgi:hypothetical protein